MNSTTQILRAGLAAAIISIGPAMAMAATESPAHVAPKAVVSNTVTPVKKAVKIVGNSQTKQCHKPFCELVKKINKENRVEFASLAEAKKAGYEPCQACLGDKTVRKSAVHSASAAVKTEAAPAKAQ